MDGTVALSWLDEAAAFSSPGEGVTRLFLSHEHRMLANWLAEKAKRVKLDYKLDDSGNVVLRRPSRQPDAKTLIIGSHQDSVRNGGKYDGMLGIVLPILVLSETLDLPFHVEIIAFGDEEGARFSSTLVGSSAIAGNFDEKLLSRTDEENVTMREAMLDFGLEPQNIADIARSPGDVIGFFEVHIEQGPILEACNTPVGLVTAISSIERHSVVVGGEAGHAGTVPMRSRNDALVKAANIVQFINELCKRTEGLVGVVGKMTVYPNSVNVIPSRVELTIELRSPHDSIRTGAREKSYNTFQR